MNPVSLAPMMERTDRHFRYLLRLISRHTLLYTEMVVAQAIVHGDREALLGFDPSEHPVALQLGGDDPTLLAECARIAEGLGYDEVNLNVGCPSSRVQKGCFGVVLMRRPERVAEAVVAMRDAVQIPVTVKHRIGLDELDRYEDMARFVERVAPSGCDRFSVHARKAWTQGLSPKQNRRIPPLRYEEVYRLKRDFPELIIEINGGVKTLEDIQTHLQHVDAVMLGRAAWDRPWLFSEVDRAVYGDETELPPTREEVVEAYVEYIERWLAQGWKLTPLLRNLLNLFAGERGTGVWKRTLSGISRLEEPVSDLVARALEAVENERSRALEAAEERLQPSIARVPDGGASR